MVLQHVQYKFSSPFQTTIKLDGDKLVHTEKPADGKGKIPSYTWELTDSNDLHIVRIGFTHLEKITESCVRRKHGRQLGQILPRSVFSFSKNFKEILLIVSSF